MQINGPLRNVILSLFANWRKATISFVMNDFKVVYSVHFFLHQSSVGIIKGVLRHVCLSICPSTWNKSSPTGQLFVKFNIEVF